MLKLFIGEFPRVKLPAWGQPDERPLERFKLVDTGALLLRERLKLPTGAWLRSRVMTPGRFTRLLEPVERPSRTESEL